MPTTINMDLDSLARELVRMAEEIYKSQSSSLLAMHPDDLKRFRSYISAQVDKINMFQGQPLLDRPETTPKEITVEDWPAEVNNPVENEIVRDIVRTLEVAFLELVRSASTRWGNRFVIFDYDRYLSYLERCSQLLNHAERIQPTDMPESSPRRVVSGEGRTGGYQPLGTS